MRKILFVACLVLLSTSVAMAQSKLDAHWNCAKSSAVHSLDVGDKPNHAYMISQGSCTATKGEIGNVKEKEGAGTEFHEATGNANSWHGIFVETMANGDKIHYGYHGSGTTKDGSLVSGKHQWTIMDGTGKFKGAKGSGTCSGKGAADGTSVWECTGTYTLATMK